MSTSSEQPTRSRTGGIDRTADSSRVNLGTALGIVILIGLTVLAGVLLTG
jgi:hypothetical protein